MIYVFGYASLVALEEPGAVPGRLRGYRRFWGAAMNNWEGGAAAKHWLDRDTGERPRIRVAYLDIEPCEGASLNGLAIPVDPQRLPSLDAREINYRRVDVTGAFEPSPGEGEAPPCVHTYVGLDAAHERCRQGVAAADTFVSRDYLAGVRRGFERLGSDALAEFERTTAPSPFPERDLRVVLPA